MMNNKSWMLVAFAVVVACVTFYLRLNDQKYYNETLAKISKSQKLETYDFSKGFFALCIICMIFGVLSSAYGFYQGDSASGAVGIVIAAIFFGELFSLKRRYCFVYSDKGFVGNSKNSTEFVEFKSIKKVQHSDGKGLTWKKVETFGGKEYRVSPKSAQIIEEKQLNRKKKLSRY
jgi:hypothetical protein